MIKVSQSNFWIQHLAFALFLHAWWKGVCLYFDNFWYLNLKDCKVAIVCSLSLRLLANRCRFSRTVISAECSTCRAPSWRSNGTNKWNEAKKLRLKEQWTWWPKGITDYSLPRNRVFVEKLPIFEKLCNKSILLKCFQHFSHWLA